MGVADENTKALQNHVNNKNAEKKLADAALLASLGVLVGKGKIEG